jgi:hypothetical protein
MLSLQKLYFPVKFSFFNQFFGMLRKQHFGCGEGVD